MRVAEEIVLLLFDEAAGGMTARVPGRTLDVLLAGAVLMDLALENRIDTDLEQLMLVDPTPLDDDILDPALAAVAAEAKRHDTQFWVARIAETGEDLRERTLARLVERGILEIEESGTFSLVDRVSRSRRYPTEDGGSVDEVRLRIMRILFAEEIPDPRDIVIVCLANAGGIFGGILSKSELAEARDRIDLLSRMDLIGRAVADAVLRHNTAVSSPPPDPSPKSIPCARGLPIAGNAFDMAGDIGAFLARQYVELGPVFRIRAFKRNFVVLAGPEANLFVGGEGKTCLRSFDVFRDFNASMKAMRSIIAVDGAEHHRMRKELAGGYSRVHLESRSERAMQVVRQELAEWPAGAERGGQYLLQRIVVEQISRTIAGMGALEYVDDVIVFLRSILSVHVLNRQPALLMKLPRQRRAARRMQELALKVMTAERATRGPDERPYIIDDILDLHRRDPQYLPELDLTIFVLGPFLVGVDTAASASAFVLYEVLKRPELKARLTAEADSVFRHDVPDMQALRRADVTRRTVMETLRIRPVIPAIRRMASNTFQFAGHEIAAGANVLLGMTVPHHLPEFFPDPRRFDIERFCSERAEHKQKGVYVPFGIGPHLCLGRGFAEAQIALNIAALLHEAELELSPPGYSLKVDHVPGAHPHKSFKVRLLGRRTS